MAKRFSHERANAMRAGRAAARLSEFEAMDETTKDLASKAGKPRYSRAAGKLMNPEPCKTIDPDSPEGRAIIEGLNANQGTHR